MARREAAQDEDSMDSLLDTMMNVVGILIIVLVVTQLGVGGAVERIGETIAVDPQMLAEAQKKLAELEKLRERLEAALLNTVPVDDQDYDKRLAELREQISLRQQQLDQLLVQQKTDEDEQTKAQAIAVAVTKQMDEDKGAREKLQKDITTAQDQEARLKAMLADTSPRGQAPPVQITLPNPRPAPDGAR
jgi:DNA repair exonuclease SbcCD ATPase subunit